MSSDGNGIPRISGYIAKQIEQAGSRRDKATILTGASLPEGTHECEAVTYDGATVRGIKCHKGCPYGSVIRAGLVRGDELVSIRPVLDNECTGGCLHAAYPKAENPDQMPRRRGWGFIR
ncbi:MAG: hypothetical protein HYW26_02455 [Candidatus Aenigmarchaeota archaeon]|nr:hypothetical protein [Candidatus Aenigmarchaeota archaeon]